MFSAMNMDSLFYSLDRDRDGRLSMDELNWEGEDAHLVWSVPASRVRARLGSAHGGVNSNWAPRRSGWAVEEEFAVLGPRPFDPSRGEARHDGVSWG